MKKNQLRKYERGITLIALVVTLVVLLILAAVSIGMLTGENGIIKQSNDAKTETRSGEVEDKVDMWKTENKLYKYSNVNVITEEELIEDLKKQGLVLEGELDETNKIITIGTRKISYAIEQENLDFDEIIADLKNNPDKYLEQAKEKGQTKEKNNNIGIGTNKEVVNLDLWKYNKTADGLGIILGPTGGYNSKSNPYYLGNIVNGKIIGEIPQYIYLEEEGENPQVYPVTQMRETFIGIETLEETPKIPDTVTSLGEKTFFECISLKNITIPSTVMNIENSAFAGCIKLTSIKVDENNSKYDSRNDCNAIIETSTNKLIVGCKTTEIPLNIVTIGESAFFYCLELTSITIPSSVTSIESYAFALCNALTSITIPSSVTTMGDYVFLNWEEGQIINCEIEEEKKPTTWSEDWDSYLEGEARKAQLNWGIK